MSILLYACTTGSLTKCAEKKLDGNCTRMLRAVLKKSWRQHHKKQQLYGHLPPISKTIQIRRTRHAGHGWISKNEFISDVLPAPLHMGKQRLHDQQEPIYNSSVLMQDVAWKTCWEQWTRETKRYLNVHIVFIIQKSLQRWIFLICHWHLSKHPSLCKLF